MKCDFLLFKSGFFLQLYVSEQGTIKSVAPFSKPNHAYPSLIHKHRLAFTAAKLSRNTLGCRHFSFIT